MSSLGRPRFRRRLVTLAVLALWVAPAASALAAGAHLALEHHAEARHHHDATALELALAAVHGHHHDLGAVPDHEHPAPVTAGPVAGSSAPPAAAASLADPAAPRLAGAVAGTVLPARHGPPVPLFAAHCSLLL